MKTRQEKIKEGVFEIIREADLDETPEEEVWECNLTNKILSYLSSQGGVIKGSKHVEADNLYYVEPLIKE